MQNFMQLFNALMSALEMLLKSLQGLKLEKVQKRKFGARRLN
jgi:hypothetical protein